MVNLNEEEMNLVNGGGRLLRTFWGIVSAGVVFILGIVDGVISPKKCNY